MQFVNNEQTDCLNVLSLFPATRQHVPLLRSADNDVALHTMTQFKLMQQKWKYKFNIN